MTHARKPGTLAARVTDVLHTLSPEAIKRAGTSMHQMRRFSNPMEPARIPLDVAAQLDGELTYADVQPLQRRAN
jgi:hypothetical protein